MPDADRNTRSGIICAGNWILDTVYDLPHWPNESDLVSIGAQKSDLGGGGANVAAALAALGVLYPVIPVGVVGDDREGTEIRNLCANRGLPTDYLKTLSGQITAHTHVMNVPGKSRTFFYRAGVNDEFGMSHVDIDALSTLRARFFYLGYLTLLPMLDEMANSKETNAALLLAKARSAGMTTCVDLVSTTRPDYRETVYATLKQVDFLLLNEIEAGRATGQENLEADDVAGLKRAAEKLLSVGVQKAVVLHTPKHVIWADHADTKLFQVAPVHPDKIASPVGAGDAFAAGFLHGLHENWNDEDCVAFGNAVAAASLQGFTATDGIPELSEIS